jgi:ABC-type transporter Mla subunit MlaD
MKNTETRIPRWVKVLGIVVILLVLLVVIVMFLLPGGGDGGGHQPRFDHGLGRIA